MTVYTEHTDRIHPRDLSKGLAAKVGKDKFFVSLRRNIYIIYIDERGQNNDDVGTAPSLEDSANATAQEQDALSDDGEKTSRPSIEPPTYQQRLADFEVAEKILCASRLSQK